ncbi:MAG: hypothetical protein M1819_000415 [Sarea resinae]|nr:MAG: hypothetical protein M1819_000415 [Sarea resinae]
MFMTPTVDDGSKGAGSQVVVLPLNIIALIISYIDDVADLARICRTSRVLHYMTLPQLYHDVTLRSYRSIRYVGGQPEGCGSASPFSMGLHGLVTRTVCGLVRSFRVCGEWKEHDLEEHARVGRVPDNSMMLNIAMRAALDRMEHLESFSWELNTKTLKTVYDGLASRPALTSLTIKFPSLRLPRPTTTIPPMPLLTFLKVTNIDPLCYPDDISLLLLSAKKLRDLRLSWNPRMRDEAEPSVNLHSYFGKCLAANYNLKVVSVSLQNLYAQNNVDFRTMFDHETLRSFTFLNSPGPTSDTVTAFLDHTWNMKPPDNIQLKAIRFDKPSPAHVEFVSNTKGLEEIYVVNAKRTPASSGVTSVNGTPSSSMPPVSPSRRIPSPVDLTASKSLGMRYFDAISGSHGATLKILLLSERWVLSLDDAAGLAEHCPNLEQLGAAINMSYGDLWSLLWPSTPKVYALRILNSPDAAALVPHVGQSVDDFIEEQLSQELAKVAFKHFQWVGVGDDVFQCGSKITMDDATEEGAPVCRRELKRVSRDAVNHIQIWGQDTLEI